MVTLAWLDWGVLLAYLLGMLGCGLFWARRSRSDDEYFLVGRRVPWLVAGLSVVASMLSSITYLAEPGEVWKSGVTHVAGKLLGIPIEMAIVWGFCIPFMMRFRFTSAYEYLEHRFGTATRRLGATLFVTMVVLWMGFVVLVLSQVVEQLSGIPLVAVVLSVGVVATAYTMLGGLRAVVWTDVIQVALLVAGAVITIGYVVWATGSWIPDWLAATRQHMLANGQPTTIAFFSLDPTVRATVVSVAVNMAVWHVCIHTSNQITVQRYFSTPDVTAARRSFIASSIAHVVISLLLVMVGLSVLHYYTSAGRPLDRQLDPETQRDLIFPTFALQHLPAGAGGAILAALLAAAMSTVDSGVNSIATVVALELRPAGGPAAGGRANRAEPAQDLVADGRPCTHVRLAMTITVIAGAGITLAAYALTFLPARWGIVGGIPRTFNAVTGPLGGLFLIGIFLPGVRQRSAIVATLCGLLVSIVLGYLQQIGALLGCWGLPGMAWPEVSFAWILPCSMLATLVAAPLLGLWDPSPARDLAGLTWVTRREPTSITNGT